MLLSSNTNGGSDTNTAKKVILSILMFNIMIFIIACNNGKTSNNSKTTSVEIKETAIENANPEKKFSIGWSVKSTEYEFFRTMQDGVLARAKELGIDVLTHDEKDSTSEMITGVSDLIAQGIDALVISPVTPEAMIIISNLAKEENIPLIVIDTGYDGADIDAFIVSDSLGGGVLAGEYAINLIRKHSISSKNAAIITLQPEYIYARRRGEGFKNVMKESQYEIVAEVAGNSDQSIAYEEMKGILEKYGEDLAVVFAENDIMALGAAQAIDEAGLKGKIMVIGFDGDSAAIEAIKEGLMQGTIAQQPFEMGELGVELAHTLLTGGMIVYDDKIAKELYVEIYLIDETGEAKKSF